MGQNETETTSLEPSAPGAMHEMPSARIVTLVRGLEMFALVLPERKVRVDAVPWEGCAAPGGTARCVDLETETGRISQAAWRSGDGGGVDGGLACSVPTLIAFDSGVHSVSHEAAP